MSMITREEKEFLETLPKALYSISDAINRVADALKGDNARSAKDPLRIVPDSYKRFKKCGNNSRRDINESHRTNKGTADPT